MVEPRFGPGVAADRTVLAWTRSALNIAATGALIARAGFNAHLDALGVLSAVAMALFALQTWRRGQAIYAERTLAGMHTRPQTRALQLLTAGTLALAATATGIALAL